MIRADEYRDVLRGGALHERRPDGSPCRGETVGVRRQRGADLVPGRRKLPQQDVPAVGAAPAVQVALLARLAAQPPPHHASPDAELARQRRPYRGVAECIGRIQHVEPSPEPLRVGGAELQVTHQRLAGGDQLVGQDVPRPQLEPSGLDERLELRLPLRTGAQIVGDEHRLTVEQETAVTRVGLEPLEQVVQRGDEPRLERGARQIPLAVPVRVRDEVEDEPAHWP